MADRYDVKITHPDFGRELRVSVKDTLADAHIVCENIMGIRSSDYDPDKQGVFFACSNDTALIDPIALFSAVLQALVENMTDEQRDQFGQKVIDAFKSGASGD